MNKSYVISVILAFFLAPVFVFAGVDWEAKTVTKTGDKESTMITHGYAQKGNIREDFVKGTENPVYKKGSYFLYLNNTNMVFLVNTEKKTYSELSIEDLSQTMGAIGKVIQIKVSNPKVEVQKLPPEKVTTYSCQHISIASSYDMETKIAFISSKSHIDQTHEIWGSSAVSTKDFSDIYNSKAVKTSFKELDDLIEKQMESLKNLGFVMKSVLIQKTTGEDKKVEESATTMTASNIKISKLNDDLFKIPSGYKKTAMIPDEENSSKESSSGDDKDKKKDTDVNAEDLIKGLFK